MTDALLCPSIRPTSTMEGLHPPENFNGHLVSVDQANIDHGGSEVEALHWHERGVSVDQANIDHGGEDRDPVSGLVVPCPSIRPTSTMEGRFSLTAI